MGLRKCRDCRNSVSSRADVCPHCGGPMPAKTSLITAFVALVLVIAVFAGMCQRFSSDEAKLADVPSRPRAQNSSSDRRSPGEASRTIHELPEETKESDKVSAASAATGVGNFVLRGISESNGLAKARFSQKVTGKRVYLSTGEVIEGWVISEIDFPRKRVTLKNETDGQIITLQPDDSAPKVSRDAKKERLLKEEDERRANQQVSDRSTLYVAALNAAGAKLVENVAVEQTGDVWEARLTVKDLWHIRHYQVRLQDAQTLWDLWARIASPKQPDLARISIVDHRGNEVGGSRIWGGSLIWVQED